VDGGEPLVEPEARSPQWRPPVLGEGTPHRQTVPVDGLSNGVGAVFELPFDGTHAAYELFELGLGMAVRFEDRPRRLPQVVELAQLVRDSGECRRHRAANRLLAIGDHAADGHREGRLHFLQEAGEVLGRRAEQATSE
jgi:hypothetical protein